MRDELFTDYWAEAEIDASFESCNDCDVQINDCQCDIEDAEHFRLEGLS